MVANRIAPTTEGPGEQRRSRKSQYANSAARQWIETDQRCTKRSWIWPWCRGASASKNVNGLTALGSTWPTGGCPNHSYGFHSSTDQCRMAKTSASSLGTTMFARSMLARKVYCLVRTSFQKTATTPATANRGGQRRGHVRLAHLPASATRPEVGVIISKYSSLVSLGRHFNRGVGHA